MGRLTERCGNETLLKKIGLASCSYICKEIDGISYTCNECPVGEAFNKLAHYEDLEEAGRLVEVVRCKDCAKGQPDIFKDILWCDGRMVEPNHYCSYAKLKEMEEVK